MSAADSLNPDQFGGSNGPLPDLHYNNHLAENTGAANNVVEAWKHEDVGEWSSAAPHARNVYAGSFLDPGQRPVASLSWHPNGEIKGIYTDPSVQRRGVATELLRRAREIDPTVHHSEYLSKAGEAFSRARS